MSATCYEIVQEYIKQHFNQLPCSLLTCQSNFPLFTDEECDEICRLAYEQGFAEAKVGRTGDTRVDKACNSSMVCYLHDHLNMSFVYERVRGFVNKANEKFWNFDLFDYGEPFKFAEYKENTGTDFHSDITDYCTTGFRKLTIIIQLSREDDYKGGELVVNGETNIVSRKRGHVIVFPSFLLHKVNQITEGKRCSLVGFAYGPPLR